MDARLSSLILLGLIINSIVIIQVDSFLYFLDRIVYRMILTFYREFGQAVYEKSGMYARDDNLGSLMSSVTQFETGSNIYLLRHFGPARNDGNNIANALAASIYEDPKDPIYHEVFGSDTFDVSMRQRKLRRYIANWASARKSDLVARYSKYVDGATEEMLQGHLDAVISRDGVEWGGFGFELVSEALNLSVVVLTFEADGLNVANKEVFSSSKFQKAYVFLANYPVGKILDFHSPKDCYTGVTVTEQPSECMMRGAIDYDHYRDAWKAQMEFETSISAIPADVGAALLKAYHERSESVEAYAKDLVETKKSTARELYAALLFWNKPLPCLVGKKRRANEDRTMNG